MKKWHILFGSIVHLGIRLVIISILRRFLDMSRHICSGQNRLFSNRTIGLIIDKIKVLLKSLINEKGTLKAIWKLVYTSIGYISSIYTLSVILNELTNCDIILVFFKECVWMLCVLGVAASFIHNRERTTCKYTVGEDDLQVVTTVSDLLCAKADSYVIPTNTYFRTILENEYISPQSVQGAFQYEYFKNDSELLDEMIAESLRAQGLSGVDKSDVFGHVKRYPIGSVVKIDRRGKHFYLVAIADVNEFGKPVNQNYDCIINALVGLIESINRFGHCDDLAIPILGAGRAAIREANIDKVYVDIIKHFMSFDGRIVRKLVVCIRPKDYLDEKVDLKRIEKYLDFRSTFNEK